MKMRYQIVIHFDELGDLAAILCAVEQEVQERTPVGSVQMIAEQVHTFDPEEFRDDEDEDD